MNDALISRDMALRIALAARVLPDTTAAQLLNVLDDAIGLPPTPGKLATLTVKSLKSAADGEFANMNTDAIKLALEFLKNEQANSAKNDALKIDAYTAGDMPDSIRVACASNKDEELDGHFGSCARFLVYQVSASEIRLIAARQTNTADAEEDKNAYRTKLIADCQVLFVASIGGPAAAKVVKAGIHPIKHASGGHARASLSALQKIINDAPPPWLAKTMGHDVASRVRFARYTTES